MSEVSDAVIIVVSEETGKISVAADSAIQSGLSTQNLAKFLTLKLTPPAQDKRLRFGRKPESKQKA
jgi:diadenylate cyclase